MNVSAATATKVSRETILKDRVVIRLALDGTGMQIAEVLKENGIELPGCDWSRVYPHWLIATDGDQVIGCCQVLMSKPVGYVEFLFVRQSISFKLRAIAIRKLIMESLATHLANGCSYVGAILDAKNEKFADVLGKINFVKAANNVMLVKRLK